MGYGIKKPGDVISQPCGHFFVVPCCFDIVHHGEEDILCQLPGTPLKWVGGMRLYLAAMYARHLACTHSSALPITSSNCMSLYDQGSE